ncbi:type II toxin-antitoxin system RelE/ParE family toxin [Streptomyces sp. NBC_01233]|uniref:type II toxin-antitoxin system RelE/ParE family toxin n=1 Tax=Streptomyces sp. NBC_01233 TaxID=2903787 RepID=UPI003FA358ED
MASHPRRARIVFSESAAKQLEDLTAEGAIHALDRALVAISVNPEIGEPIPADGTGPELRQYADEIEDVRVLYFVAALRTVVVVAYIET